MSIKITWIIVTCIFSTIIVFSIYRDLQIIRYDSGDLRNRVVGARLIKDHKSPYFYKWNPGDGMRYYDPYNFDHLKVANITATPFFHHLIAPIANFPELEISRYWLLIEYVMFFTIVGIAFSITASTAQKWAVLLAAAFFLLTEAWQFHVYKGQYYLSFPFFSMLFYYTVNKKKQTFWGICAGVIAISLILIRPNTILFFIPFLLLLKGCSRNYVLALLLPAVLAVIWFVLDRQERFLWQDYRYSISEQLKFHQQLNPSFYKGLPDPAYPVWEGIDETRMRIEGGNESILNNSESGNFFVITEHIFHKKISLPVLTSILVIAIIMLGALFYWWASLNYPLPTVTIAIMGFCLFMLSDLFSPIRRFQYYTIQWIGAVLLAVAFFKPSLKWPYLFLWIGLILNCVNLNFMKMEHTIGEYMFLLGLVALVLTSKFEKAV